MPNVYPCPAIELIAPCLLAKEIPRYGFQHSVCTALLVSRPERTLLSVVEIEAHLVSAACAPVGVAVKVNVVAVKFDWAIE